MTAGPEVVVEATEAALAADVAARVVATLAHAQRERGTASLVVTAGTVLERVFSMLAAEPAATAVDWSKVDVFWGDERFVPAGSEDRNDLQVERLLLDRLPIEAARVHRMPGSDGPDGDDVDAAARRYAALLADIADPRHRYDADVPAFDVVLLGVGQDGHCCSLFPEHPGVYEDGLTVIGVHGSPKPPPTRISLTFRALEAAEEVWAVVAGEGKAAAVAMALGGAGRVQIPSAGARGRHRTLWLLDRAAARKLPKSIYTAPVA